MAKTIESTAGFFLADLDEFVGRVVDLRPALRAGGELGRGLVVQEIKTRTWRPPTGPLRPWKPTHRFGTFVPAKPTFGQAYTNAWQGGPGGFMRVSQLSVSYGVDLTRFPWMVFHRPGTGPISDLSMTSKGARIRPIKIARGRTQADLEPEKWAQYWWLRFNLKVKLTAEKMREGLFLPFRPHATINPLLRTQWVALVSRQVIGR